MIPDFPDYCEALIGYRQWRCFPNGLLTGISQGEAWPPYQAWRKILRGMVYLELTQSAGRKADDLTITSEE